MDNILEILVPLIFAAVYFFGNMFSGKSKEGEDGPPGLPRRRDAEEDDADVIERQRRIQEEIRRKIMERRGRSGSEPPAPVPSAQELRERRRELQGSRTTREAQKTTREVVHESSHEVPPYMAPTRDSETQASSPAFSWDESDNAYDHGMQAKLERIEETKRKAEKLNKQAAARSKATGQEDKPKRRSGGYFTGSVRESLQDPAAARAALIYAEVLGQPVSLRKGGSSVPGLN